MAASRVVLASKVGGIPEVVTNLENGFLFENNNFDDLYSILNTLYNNNKLLSQISKKSKAYILKERNPKTIKNNLINFYRSI